MEATMTKYNFEQFIPLRKKPFDRKTFDLKEYGASSLIARLRAPGGRRWFLQGWRKWTGEYVYAPTVSMSYIHLPNVSFKGKRLIDAGCGDSGDADMFVAQGGEAIGYDLFPRKEVIDFPKTQKSKGFQWRRKSDFLVQDICEEWPAEDASVDYVTCNAVLDLMEIADRGLFYKHSLRVLKSGGVLSLSFVRLANGHGYILEEERDWLLNLGFGTVKKDYADSLIATKI